MRFLSSSFYKRLIATIAFAVVLAIGLVLFQPRPQAAPPLPSPNGYDDFVKAGRLIATNNLDSYNSSIEELREMAPQYAEALRLVRTGLSRECRVPSVSTQYTDTVHIKELVSMKQLAQAFSAEGKLAELEHRNGDAARTYLDAMKLGHEAARGSTLMSGLVRLAIEGIGSTGLRSVATNLNAAECRDVIVALETLDKREESVEDVMKNEKEWVRQNFSSYQRTVGSFMRLFNVGSVKQDIQKAEQRIKTQGQKRGALLIGIGARAYELEKGQPPKTALDLVPDYLNEIPKDPIGGTNMVLKTL